MCTQLHTRECTQRENESCECRRGGACPFPGTLHNFCCCPLFNLSALYIDDCIIKVAAIQLDKSKH